MKTKPFGWTKSSFSSPNGNCVEVSYDGDVVLIRESDRPDEQIETSPDKFAAFIAPAKAGEFDIVS
mgnify:CR=1 FL=1